MPRLVAFFSPFISLGLELDALIAAGSAPASGWSVQQQAHKLLERAREAALAFGKPRHGVESASFAMIAWLDEIAARNKAWSVDLTPLQVLLFNSNNASTEFFHHLSALQPHEDEVREVYWLALAHGFTGQYYFEDGDAGELGKLKELHAQQLPVAPLAAASLAQDRITPQPYGSPRLKGPRIPQRRERAVLRAAAALALLAPVAWVFANWATLSHRTEDTPAKQIEQRLQHYACADLSAVATPNGSTRVSGFVSKPEDIAAVQHEVAEMPVANTPSFDLQVRAWPHCEVVSILKSYRTRNKERQAGLAIETPTAHGGLLREGDPVVISVVTARQDGYLWVDYFNADGAVLHFNAGKGQPRLPAGARVELGKDIPSSWLVNPPFGAVLISALSSPSAFNETIDRPPFELASDYLLRLREVLSSNKGGEGLVADFTFLETTGR